MSYFLKKTKNRKGTYLQIYESVYDAERGYGVHRSVRPIGYVHELQDSGIADPVAHFKREVELMNDEAKREKANGKAANRTGKRVAEIGDTSPLRWLGHFALRAVWAGLGVDTDLAYLQLNYGLPFSASELLEDLACAHMLCPRSEGMAYHDVLPRLAHEPTYTTAQLGDGLNFLGREREKAIEILGERVDHTYPLDTSYSYFLDIDSYHGDDAVLNVSLLLDAACVPLEMDFRISDADESPEPIAIIAGLRERYGIEGRTVRISDNLGSGCANAIVDAVREGDGYLVFRSADQLDEHEIAWLLSEDGWENCGSGSTDHLRTKSATVETTYRVAGENGVHDALALTEKYVATFSERLRGERLREIGREVDRARHLVASNAEPSAFGDSARFVRLDAAKKDGNASVSLDHDAIDRARALAGYGMLVTSELTLPDDEVAHVYERLCAVAGAFRDTLARLDDTPVFAHEDTIAGRLVVAYTAVLLMRLLEAHVLAERFDTDDILDFMRAFEIVRVSDRTYVNLAGRSEVGDALHEITGLPIKLRQLTKAQCNKILSYVLKETKRGA